MERINVDSSMINTIGFQSGTLEVEFSSGKTYQYFGVPDEVFEDMKNSVSMGKFFNQKIKSTYDSIPL